MRFKKVLSVFLATLMLFSVMSLGFTGAAAEIDYNAQYQMLADALKNEHVRDLTNYTSTNEKLKNETEGFDQEAHGFAYDHKVVARDNDEGHILKASNRFYFIAESLMSYTYGFGCYDASTLISYVTEKLKPFFNDDILYEDFYGNRYEPTADEIAAYNAAVAEIEAAGREIDKISLPEYGIYFIHKDEWEYYNVESILRYFMGDVVKVNVGNWYHKFSFVVQTSVSTILEDGEGIPEDTTLIIRTAAYEIAYEKFYNESMSKSYFSFAEPSLQRVWESYGDEYGFVDRESIKLDGPRQLLSGGQASAYLIMETDDDITVPYLSDIKEAFDHFLNNSSGKKWDEVFVNLSDAEINNPSAYADLLTYDTAQGTKSRVDDILGYEKYLTENLSNKALQSVFGDRLGSMVTLAYLFKKAKPEYGTVAEYTDPLEPARELTFAEKQGYAMDDTANPSRTIFGTSGGYTAKYIASADVIDDIIHDIDALISPRTGEVGVNDKYIANRVVSVVSSFLDVGELLGIEGDVQYNTLQELIKLVLNELVFSDSIINMLVELVYPMLSDLIQNTVVGAVEDAVGKTIAGWAGDILGDLVSNNELAIYPNELGRQLNSRYPGQYDANVQILNAAGTDWTRVNFAALTWGVNDAPNDQKATVFINGACAALTGLMYAVVTVMCGDAEYYNGDRGTTADWHGKNQYNGYYDKVLLTLVGGSSSGNIADVKLRAPGVYTKVIIPLFRVLGINEISSYTPGKTNPGYVNSGLFHSLVDQKWDYSLKLILEPLVYWIQEVLAARPIETVMTLIPNLVHFLSRTSNVTITNGDWTSNTANDDSHKGYYTVQTHNLQTILENVNITITVIGIAIDIGSIGSLIGGDTINMLTSLNALLNEIISFTYNVGEGNPGIACYYDNEGNIVFEDSNEYILNPENYYPSTEYYSDKDHTTFSLTPTETHTERHQKLVYDKAPFYIPSIPEKKLLSCGTVYSPTTHNTIKVDNPGQVFKFLLRYVLSAVGYKYDVNNEELPTVIECLGLDMSSELFAGLSLGDIITNVMLHPDEALCALLELFYTGEVGELYKVIGYNEDGTPVVGRGETYTYPVANIRYYERTLVNPLINPTLTYGTEVKYSQYWTKEYADDFIGSLTPLAEDVLILLGIEGVEDGLGAFLENMLNDMLFTDDIVNTLFNLIYQLIADLAGGSFDIEGLLWSVFDVSFDTEDIATALDKMLGYTSPASATIRKAKSWAEIFETEEIDPETGEVVTDPETGEVSMVLEDVELEWGITPAVEEILEGEDGEEIIVYEELALCELNGVSRADAMLRSLAALLSPAAFVLKFLFMDQNLSVLGLINLPGYAGYQYAFIGLLEALSCPNILTYEDYYKASLDPDCGDANVIYYLFAPLLGLIEKVYADPLNTVLSLIPNLLFFISIGGLNDLVNNLVHFVYVLLDMLKPIVNGYDLVGGLLANIEISGMSLNLSLPLDIDFNSLISDLLGSLLGDTLTIEGISIKLPYIDLYTLCVGTLELFSSKEARKTVHLNAAGGGELLTALLRIVFEVLFMDENHKALSQIVASLAEEGRLDAYDEETLYLVINGLIGLIEEYEVLDIVLMAVYLLVTNLVPIADTLAPKFQEKGMTITDLIDSMGSTDEFVATLSKLLSDEEETPGEISDGKAVFSLLDRLKAFFEKIKLFFQQLFAF